MIMIMRRSAVIRLEHRRTVYKFGVILLVINGQPVVRYDTCTDHQMHWLRSHD